MDAYDPAARARIKAAFESLAERREGCEYTAYHDERGILTGGIGHRITAADDRELPAGRVWRIGMAIPHPLVDAWFDADSARAQAAAYAQAADAGIWCEAFMPALMAVNFQLGTDWRAEFPHTWDQIVAGEYQAAATGLEETLWAKQTPARVADFQAALRGLVGQGAA